MTTLTKPMDVTDATFNDFVKQHPNVVVDLWAPWCGPCKRIAPILDELAAEYGGRVAVAKVNTDENAAVMTRYGVMSIPTLLVFKNGQRVDQIVGFQPKPSLKQRFDKAFGI